MGTFPDGRRRGEGVNIRIGDFRKAQVCRGWGMVCARKSEGISVWPLAYEEGSKGLIIFYLWLQAGSS